MWHRLRHVRQPALAIAGASSTTLLVAAAFALAAFIRIVPPLSRDFPLNDGALFFRMADELAANHFRLPGFTNYNGEGIPYAYSPLGFYLAALLDTLLPGSLLDMFRIVPGIVSTACVVAFALLARDLIGARATVIVSLVVFAVLPRSFLWLIMGGGLTRSLGFLFAILTLWQLRRAYTRQAWRHVALAALFASLTVLSHLGTAPFVAFSAVLLLAFFGRHRFGLKASVVAAAGTLVLTAPWWVTILAQHGLDPFFAAGATGGTVFSRRTTGMVLGKLAFFGLGTAEPLFPLIGALAIVGALASFTRRGAFLPVWWLTIILLDARAGATYASIPVALLAAVAITDVIVPSVALGASWCRTTSATSGGTGWTTLATVSARRRWVVAIVLAVFASYGIASALVRRPHLHAEGRYLMSLSPADRDALRWVATATPQASRFVIVVGGAAGGWWADRVAEWFPVLADRRSVATVQGTEWLADGAFERREQAYDRLQACAIWGASCVEQWSRDHALDYSHIYLPKTLAFPCCAPLDAALRLDTRYRLVFDGPGAAIFARRVPLSGLDGADKW